MTGSPQFPILFALACIIVQIILSVVYAPRLQDPMITHWGVDGRPNGSMPKRLGLLVGPALSALLGVVGISAELHRAGASAFPVISIQVILLIIMVFTYQRNRM